MTTKSTVKITHYATKEVWKEARLNYITSTEVPLLFGIEKYGNTLFSLWHEKHSKQEAPFAEDERILWGKRFEDVIGHVAAEENGWIITGNGSTNNSLITNEKHPRLAASFDFLMDDENREKAILEIKCVDGLIFAKEWEASEDGESWEMPLTRELQLQLQLMVSELKTAYLAALVGGNRLVIVKREPSTELQNLITEKSTDFWESIRLGKEPPLSSSGADLAHIKRLYSAINTEMVEADEEADKISLEYEAVSEQIKELTKKKNHAKSILVQKCGNANKIIGSNFTMSRSSVAEKEISYLRKGYTVEKITMRSNRR